MKYTGIIGKGSILLTIAFLFVIPMAFSALDPVEFYKDHSEMKGSRGMYRIDTYWLGTDIADIELLDNSDICLYDCLADLRFRPYRDMKLSQKDLYLEFIDVKGRNSDLKDFSIKLLVNNTVEKSREVCISYQNHTYYNETNESNESYIVETCNEYEKQYYNEIISEYKEFDRKKVLFEAGKDYYLRFEGTKKKPVNIDWIPTFMGYKLDNWAWWNSSYDYKRNITNDTSSYDLAMAINGTDGFGSNIIWFNPSQIGGTSQLYYDNTSSYVVANDTDEANYESEGLTLNNSATSTYSSNALNIFHMNNIRDATGNNDLSISGSVTQVAGVYNNSYNFAGTNDYATISTHFVDSTDDTLTICMWIYPTVNGAFQRIVDSIDSESDFTIQLRGDDNKVRWLSEAGGGLRYDVNSDDAFTTNQWLHLCVQNNGTHSLMYINGSLQADIDSTGVGAIDGATTYFGVRGSTLGEDYTGRIDEIRVYDRALSSDEVEALYNNSQGLNNLLGSEESAAAITLTKTGQTPADVTSGNIFNESLKVQYNITEEGSTVLDETLLFFKTNTTTSDVNYYINGTAVEGYQNTSNSSVNGDLYNYTLGDNQIYPATYNLDPSIFRAIAPSSQALTSYDDMLKIKLFNVSNTTQYSEFEIMYNSSSGTTPSKVYYCNSSYSVGDPDDDSVVVNPLLPAIPINCEHIYDIPYNVSYDHCHGGTNSCHIVIPVPINITEGKIGNTSVTNTSYFIIRGANSSQWDAYYISNVTRSNQIQISSDGSSWSNFAGTINAHLHQFTGDENISYYSWANNTDGNTYTSSTYTESIELDNLPPGAVIFYEPTNNDTFEDEIIINYSAAISPQNDTIEYYNITYYYENYSFIDTIIGNNSNNLTYNWSLSSISEGSYRIGVEAFDNNSLSTLIYSDTFSIQKIDPHISIDWNESNINTSVANHTINFNVTDSVSSSFNCTLDLNGVSSTQNTTNNTITYANISLVPGTNYANISCTDQGGSTNYTYSTYNLDEFIDEDCSLGNVLYNFSFYDVEDDSSINADMESLFYIYNSTGDNVYNYSEEVTNVSYYELCVLNYTSDYTISSFQEYSSEGYETANYSARTYYLSDASMTAQNNISLYLLDEDEVTQVLFHTTDNVGVAYPDLYIKVQEFDISAGSSRNVMILKTDSNGEALANLNLYETWYTFIIEDEEGNVLKTTTPQQLNTNEYYFRINPSVVVLKNYLDITGLSYTLTYSNSTNVTRFTLTDTTGLSNTICLRITELGLSGKTETYSSCVTSTSADITYTFGPTETNTYIATGYITTDGEFDGVSIVIDTLEINRGETSPYGLTGVFIAVFILGTIMFAGLFNPIAPIVLGIVGLGFLAALGILSVPITALASIFMLGAILLYFIRR